MSVVADDKQHAADFPFQYREQFKFRWTDNFLLSSVIESLSRNESDQALVALGKTKGGYGPLAETSFWIACPTKARA